MSITVDLNEINAHPVESEIVTPIMQAFNRIKELEIQISDLTLRVKMLDSLNSDIIADFNDLKEQFALMQIEKEKSQNELQPPLRGTV